MGIGGYAGYKASSFDSAVYPYSAEQAGVMLVAGKTTLPRRDGPGKIQFWSAGRSDKGVTLNMQYDVGAPVLECQAVITAVAADQSRVVAACGSDAPSDSAIARTTDELHDPMFEEHIASTLGKRAFNRKTVDAKETAAVFKNLGGMQREALKRSDEAQQMAGEEKSDATSDWYAEAGR